MADKKKPKQYTLPDGTPVRIVNLDAGGSFRRQAIEMFGTEEEKEAARKFYAERDAKRERGEKP